VLREHGAGAGWTWFGVMLLLAFLIGQVADGAPFKHHMVLLGYAAFAFWGCLQLRRATGSEHRALLAVLLVSLGYFGFYVPAAAAVLGAPVRFELHLWHGFSWVLLLSTLTLTGGGILAWHHDPWRRFAQHWARVAAWGPARWYEGALAGLDVLARRQTRVLQNGRLRIYLLVIVATTVTLVGFTLISRAGIHLAPGFGPLRLRYMAIMALILAAAWVTVRAGSRLAAIVAMGAVGYGVALIFVQFGAPDLAMTQLTIETMTVLLFVLVIHRLPLFSRIAHGWSTRLDALVALAAGGLMTVLALVAMTEHRGSRLAEYFAEQSLPAAHGRNIVNVILVDFRGMDTLGEITVLALAGAGVFALLRLGVRKGGQ